MTVGWERELVLVLTGFGGFYNANAAQLILTEVTREHGHSRRTLTSGN